MQLALQTIETVQLCYQLNKRLSAIQDIPDTFNLLHLHSPSTRSSRHKRLKIYQHKLDIVSTGFADLSANISAIGRNINLLRANLHHATMPVYSLPSEVLYLIFEIVCFSQPPVTARGIIDGTRQHLQKSWITLSSVCTQWRDIVRQSSPRLCSQLSFCSDDSFSALDTLFRASRDHPLHLQVHKRDSKLTSLPMAPVAVTQRIRSLTVDFPTGYTRFFRQRIGDSEDPDLPNRFPHLESLRIFDDRARPHDLPESICKDLIHLSNLTSLSLENCIGPPQWLLTPTLHAHGARLKEISLKMVEFAEPTQLKALLDSHPCLQKLRLEEVSYVPRTFLSYSTGLGLPHAPLGGNENNIPLEDNDDLDLPLEANTNEPLGQGTGVELGNLRVLEIINCSVRFTRSLLKLHGLDFDNRHLGDTESGASTPLSPFRNLTSLSLDFGQPGYSYAELIDRFDKLEDNEIEFSMDNLGLDRLFGEDISWREEMWKEWGQWKACYGLFDAFFDDAEKLESAVLRGSPALVAHVLDALDRATPATSASASSSLASPVHTSSSMRCSQLQEVRVQFPSGHRSYTPEQIEPLRRSLCTFLDRSILPTAAETEDDPKQKQFMRLKVPMCFSECFGAIEPTSQTVEETGHHRLHAPRGYKNGEDDTVTGTAAGASTWAKNYVVERLQSCIYGRLCRSQIPE